MAIRVSGCTTDEELARVSRFMLKHKRELHPAFTTMEMVDLLYSYMTHGRLICATEDDGRIVGAAAYYQGTPQQEFEDREVALVDVAIADRDYRGSRLFVKGLQYMTARILEEFPEVREFQIAAMAENVYLCRLYAKFTSSRHPREGLYGQEIVFSENIFKLNTILKRYDKV
ncbi:GNAT family N-acetyltransferase [Gorillibacterium sp. sgz5001074]|uniref:GNAT family N-acetyltransferase n=1 Tax=Gorillibacterium sp. sgz5001074 TaxID=3446695 RepID=UPI003F663962